MKTRRFAIILQIILLTSGNLLAQKIFREGYIEKKSGETLNGLVEYSSKRSTPIKCKFKRFDIANETIYSANDLKSFGYKNGNRFESKEYNSKTSFFEVIASGEIGLYIKDSDYFIEKGKSGLTPLKRASVNKTIPEFLRSITEGKITIPDKIDLTTDLVSLIAKYNKMAGEDSKVYNRTLSYASVEKIAINSGTNLNTFGVLSGVSMYILRMEILRADYVPAPAREICPQFGLAYERILFRRRPNLTANIELMGFKQTFYTYSEKTDHTSTIRDDSFYEFTAVKIPVMLRYSMTEKKCVPFVNIGLAYQYPFDHNFRHIREVEYLNSHEIITEENKDFVFKPHEISLLAGFGLRTRLFKGIFMNLQGRFEYGEGLFKDDSETIKKFKGRSIQPAIFMGITF